MLWKQQADLFKSMIKAENDLLTKKGAEYASDADALANFKNRAKELNEQLGLNARPEHALWLLLGKHLDSIKSYIRKGQEMSDEPIAGRIQDARNYLFLLHCLIEEAKAAPKPGAAVSVAVDASAPK